MASKALKPWRLTEEETFSSFTSWKLHLTYVLNQNSVDQPFLLSTSADAKWMKSTTEHRGLKDTADGLKKEEKALNLTSMLGYISQFVPHYLATDIVSSSTSMESIWNTIRQYYGFQHSEVNFIKFSGITWEGMESERPERLYRRLLAHLQDNMLSKGSKLKHDDALPDKDEVMSPTVERLAVLRWMELIHSKLPTLVACKFGHDLQRMTLKDLQPQIADGMEGLLEELNREEVQASRVFVPLKNRIQRRPRSNSIRTPRPMTQQPPRQQFRYQNRQQCRVCKAENRPYGNHSMGSCPYISDSERQDIV